MAETKKFICAIIANVPSSAMAGSNNFFQKRKKTAPLIQSSFCPPPTPLFFLLSVPSLRFPSLLAWRDFPCFPRNETKRAMSPIMSSGWEDYVIDLPQVRQHVKSFLRGFCWNSSMMNFGYKVWMLDYLFNSWGTVSDLIISSLISSLAGNYLWNRVTNGQLSLCMIKNVRGHRDYLG